MSTHRFDLIGSEGTVYTFELGTNAFCRLEEATAGKTFTQTIRELQGPEPSMILFRQFVKATLIGGESKTVEEIGAIVDDIGGAAMLSAAIPQMPAEEPVNA